VSAPILSSWRVAQNVISLSASSPRPRVMAFATASSGIVALRAIDSAVYSDSIVEVAMQVCDFEHQTSTEHPITSMMYPVLDLTEWYSILDLVVYLEYVTTRSIHLDTVHCPMDRRHE